MTISPYGSWRSPITSELIVAESIRLDQVALDGEAITWSELQPQKQGRCFIYRHTPQGGIEPVTPDDGEKFNVRTRVHEYGGGAFSVHDGTVYFSNFSDQRLYRQPPGGAPQPITPRGLRYADSVLDTARDRLICVGEDHSGSGQPVNTLMAVEVTGAHPTVVLASGNDFYASPRLSPDGAHLAWLTWNHPDMPWISAEVWLADVDADGALVNARHVAGGPGEAAFQPEWSPDGTLWFVSDRGGGWWNLFRLRGDAIKPVAPVQAEFGRPQWAFGMSTYAFESTERVVCTFGENGRWRLALLETRNGRMQTLEVPFTEIGQMRARPGQAVFVGGAPDAPAALVRLDLASGKYEVIRRSAQLPEAIRPYLSVAEAISFPSEGGRTAHAFYYPPRNPDFTAPEGEKIPVLVKSHGGPTAAASSTLSLSTQYWTSRGIGVLDVNYGGSTGYGRQYRLLLEGQWGVVDVQDCMAAARHLVRHRNADAQRLAISGGSAGGYTTLRALTWGGEPVFRAGASYYGVSDLEALARDTHKFESRYLDWLVGPYPQAKRLYEERAPIRHVANLSVPVIFFQGAEDRVVPPDQTERMVQALKDRGTPFGYFLFEGEQHGFRSADAIRRCLDAELYFYSMLLLRCGLQF